MRNALWLLALILVAAACWLIFGGSGTPLPASPPKSDSAALTAPAALDPGASTLARADADSGAEREESGSALDAESSSWFRLQMRIVSGELTTLPLVVARVGPAEQLQQAASRGFGLHPRDLTLEVSAPAPDDCCEVRFADVIIPVRAQGGKMLDGGWIRFDAVDQLMTVDVEVLPYVPVLFLREPDGAPLAGGVAWHKVEAFESQSHTRGAILGEDGLLCLDLRRISEVGGADTVSFGVRRPPDVGDSQTDAFTIQDFLAMPRPVVLRFAPTPILRFLLLDATRNPVEGAKAQMGHDLTEVRSGSDGWIEVLQASPPEERVIIEAAGFVRETASISPAAQQSGQEIELRPASSIRIVGEEASATGWKDYQVIIEIDGAAGGSGLLAEKFAGGRFREVSGSTSYNSSPDQLRYEMETGFSDAGVAILDGIHADVPAWVRVTWLGHQLVDERVVLRPGDGEHLVRVGRLPPRARLFGTVLDPSGTPLAGAQVRIGGPSWSEIATSGKDGSFDLQEAVVGSILRIRAVAAGLAPTEVEYLVAEHDDDSVGAINLSFGRPLHVLVLGPDGSPFMPQAGTLGKDFRPVLQVYDEWIEPTSQTPSVAGSGSWRFENMPDGSYLCRLRFGWNIAGEERRLDTASGSASVNLSSQEFEMLNQVE